MKRVRGFIIGALLGTLASIVITLALNPEKREKAISFFKAAYSSLGLDINKWIDRFSAALEAGRETARETEFRLEHETSPDYPNP
ncbi:MAG TPA: hypothetical protein VGK02_01910 [Candidatus Aquicultor sp.]|jgi:hypothetical protein